MGTQRENVVTSRHGEFFLIIGEDSLEHLFVLAEEDSSGTAKNDGGVSSLQMNRVHFEDLSSQLQTADSFQNLLDFARTKRPKSLPRRAPSATRASKMAAIQSRRHTQVQKFLAKK
jgi:hypothetical protein